MNKDKRSHIEALLATRLAADTELNELARQYWANRFETDSDCAEDLKGRRWQAFITSDRRRIYCYIYGDHEEDWDALEAPLDQLWQE